MTTFSNPGGAPSVPLPANVANAREAIFAKIEQRLQGGQPAVEPPAKNAPPTPAPTKEPVIELAPETPAPEPTVVETPVEDAPPVEAAPEPTAKAPAQPAAKPATKLSRSMEIQRRAEAAVRRARSEAGKLRPAPEPEAAKPAQAPAVDPSAQAEMGRLKASYEAAVRHLKDDPLGFAKAHGVDPGSLAAYVASGADPNARAIANIRRENEQALQRLKGEYDQKISAIQETFTASQEVQTQQNFFQFVEESKSANPEAFAALNSDLVYSPKDIWDTANHLLETRRDLRENFDEDRLLEAVEAEARKDPRWVKVQALQRQVKASQQSNAVAKPKKPNVSEVDEVAEAKSAPAPRPAPKRDPQNGQFQPAAGTPFTRHAAHVENVVRRARLIG